MALPERGVPLEIGKGIVVRQGFDVGILSFGAHLGESQRAADLIEAQGLTVTVADERFAKPLDETLINQLARKHRVLITVE